MSTVDVRAYGANPGAEYTPTNAFPPSGSPYNEERQVTLPGGIGTQMYRTVNAFFDQGTKLWTPVASAPAYAEVQNPDGSIHYYKLNSSGAWDGSGNNSVFNAVDFGLSTTDTIGTNNVTALSNAINAALNAGGGTVFIPSGTYTISGAITITFGGIPGGDHGVIIAGSGGDTELAQIGGTDTFAFSGFTSGRGVRFRDFRISYAITTVVPQTAPIAIYVEDSKNVTCERVFFKDCLQALYLDNKSNACGLIDCFIDYNNVKDQVMVFISGSDDFVHNCIFIQPSQSTVGNPPPDGPPGCTGILISSVSVVSVTDTHITDFTTGITIQGGENPVNAYFSNITCNCWSRGITIQPINSVETVLQVFFSDCVFARELDSTDPASVGVYIDTHGGATANVSDIFFINCMCFLWNAAGMQINAGQNIVITGGRYGSNASSLSTSGGIAITGTAPNVPANVSITGTDFLSQLPTPDFPTQPYAISITAAVAGLYVRGCNLTSYTTPPGPIYTSSAGTQIEVTDCAGYNDQATQLGIALPSAQPFSNTSSWTNAVNGWFGPIAFYVASGTADIYIDGYNTHLQNGSFTLSPGEYAKITVAPTHFLAIGK